MLSVFNFYRMHVCLTILNRHVFQSASYTRTCHKKMCHTYEESSFRQIYTAFLWKISSILNINTGLYSVTVCEISGYKRKIHRMHYYIQIIFVIFDLGELNKFLSRFSFSCVYKNVNLHEYQQSIDNNIKLRARVLFLFT